MQLLFYSIVGRTFQFVADGPKCGRLSGLRGRVALRGATNYVCATAVMLEQNKMEHRRQSRSGSIQQNGFVVHLTKRSLSAERQNNQPKWSPHVGLRCTITGLSWMLLETRAQRSLPVKIANNWQNLENGAASEGGQSVKGVVSNAASLLCLLEVRPDLWFGLRK